MNKLDALRRTIEVAEQNHRENGEAIAEMRNLLSIAERTNVRELEQAMAALRTLSNLNLGGLTGGYRH